MCASDSSILASGCGDASLDRRIDGDVGGVVTVLDFMAERVGDGTGGADAAGSKACKLALGENDTFMVFLGAAFNNAAVIEASTVTSSTLVHDHNHEYMNRMVDTMVVNLLFPTTF